MSDTRSEKWDRYEIQREVMAMLDSFDKPVQREIMAGLAERYDFKLMDKPAGGGRSFKTTPGRKHSY